MTPPTAAATEKAAAWLKQAGERRLVGSFSLKPESAIDDLALAIDAAHAEGIALATNFFARALEESAKELAAEEGEDALGPAIRLTRRHAQIIRSQKPEGILLQAELDARAIRRQAGEAK